MHAADPYVAEAHKGALVTTGRIVDGSLGTLLLLRSIKSTASDSQFSHRPCVSNSTAERQSMHHQRFMIIIPPQTALDFLE
jgi:hypothetical protein